eukprot:TRINITY_DN39392_c0_g1_i1.p1 TRINITY_DN39392_c0_g1~~TRINITY_DN39392_c0_g1_i1.p1  ORF type:complete len:341 (-),score=82.07 TRINITY_DN39392_c0_g1_i1:156-1178(-)
MSRRPPRSTLSSSSAASDVYKRQTYPIASYLPHQARLLAGRAAQPQPKHVAPLPVGFGDIVDLEENAQAEQSRRQVVQGVRELLHARHHEVLSNFRARDMGSTGHSGYVSQKVFREIMGRQGLEIEALMFASPGRWDETREITQVVDVRTGLKRRGPVKETLSWVQNKPVHEGPVEYERWVRACMEPEGEARALQSTADTTRDAAQLYTLWELVVVNKHALLWEFNQLDTGAVGTISVVDFHRAVQLGLGCSSSDAKLLVANIPFAAGCGYVDYRRWLVEFCADPRIDWQAYLNVSLLATGEREVQLSKAEQSARDAAKKLQQQQHMSSHNTQHERRHRF